MSISYSTPPSPLVWLLEDAGMCQNYARQTSQSLATPGAQAWVQALWGLEVGNVLVRGEARCPRAACPASCMCCRACPCGWMTPPRTAHCAKPYLWPNCMAYPCRTPVASNRRNDLACR